MVSVSVGVNNGNKQVRIVSSAFSANCLKGGNKYSHKTTRLTLTSSSPKLLLEVCMLKKSLSHRTVLLCENILTRHLDINYYSSLSENFLMLWIITSLQ